MEAYASIWKIHITKDCCISNGFYLQFKENELNPALGTFLLEVSATFSIFSSENTVLTSLTVFTSRCNIVNGFKM